MRRRKWLIGLAVSPLVLVQGCMQLTFVAAVFGGPCAFDPPPGDVSTMSIVNDASQPVRLVDCDDATCTRRVGSAGTVQANGTVERNQEACSEEHLGVLDPHGKLMGCIVLPVSDPPKVTTFRVSDKAKCGPFTD